MLSLLSYVRQRAGSGDVIGNCVIAPNDLNGYSLLREAIKDLSYDPFLIAHAVCPLGDLYVLADRTPRNETATRAPTLAPAVAPGVHLFH
jgi:hypothetical protein